jgi:hypothetical protein
MAGRYTTTVYYRSAAGNPLATRYATVVDDETEALNHALTTFRRDRRAAGALIVGCDVAFSGPAHEKATREFAL